jgi:hypothetical protein
MRALDRDAKLISDQLESTMTRYQEAIARETATSMPGDARVISRAIAPQLPTFPRKTPILVFATLAGLVLSSSAALAADLLGAKPAGQSSDGADRPEPTLGVDPGPRRFSAVREPLGDREDMADGAPPAGALDEIGAVTRRLAELRATSSRAACLLVCGDEPGPIAAEAGRRLAREGRAVLVELREGLLAEAGIVSSNPWACGLGELVAGERSFADVIERDGESRLHVIVAGKRPVRPCETLDIAIEALGETYDYLVLLSGAFVREPLARELAGAIDLALLSDGQERSELLRAGIGEVATISAVHALEHAAA